MGQINNEPEILKLRADTSITLISSLYHINFVCLDSDDKISEICDRYRIHPIQNYFNSEILTLICQNIQEDIVYHINDAFMIHLLLFTVSGIPFMFGPFSPSLLSLQNVSDIMKHYSIQNMDPQQLLFYHDSFPYIKENQARNIVSSFIHTVHPDETEKALRRIKFHGDNIEKNILDSKPVTTNTKLLEKRYIHENLFMYNIKIGNSRLALHHLRMTEQDTLFYKKLGNRMENEKIGAIIDHTVVRIAAIEAGLPVVVVDRITGENIMQIKRATTIDDIYTAKEDLIKNMCTAILKMKTQKYSALIQSALYYIDRHFTEKISLSSLSDELGISKTYLIKKFKDETGMTLNAYLNQQRMRYAATLLLDGDMSIGEISFAVGINDANYFVKLFKKEFNQTPTEYRKTHTI